MIYFNESIAHWDPYADFNGRLTFSYKANDTQVDSDAPAEVEFIIDIQAGSAETPTIWRKACLYNKDEDYLTFRSLTTDITYRPSIMLDPEVKVDRNNKTPIWKIDNSMMDASAETMERFLAGLEYLESL